MQFTSFVITAAAIAGASAQVSLTDPTYSGISVGQAFDVTWGDAAGPVTLVLKNGEPGNLQTVSTITAGLPFPTGSFEWTPDSSLTAGSYAIEIIDPSTSNFGAQFALGGATATGSATSVSVSASSTSGSSTASSSASSSGSSTSGSSTGSASSSGPTSTPASSTNSTPTSSATSSSSTSTSTNVPNSNSGSGLSSPFAMVLVSFGAMVLFN